MTLANKAPTVVYWVDAFTQKLFCGNPAVVVPLADGLTAATMQLLAREVNCSETAFITQPTTPSADLRLRWFTPTREVELCGHATVAALHVLAQEGRFKLVPGTTQILYLETRSGILTATVDYSETTSPLIWLQLPGCEFTALAAEETQRLSQLLGLAVTSAAAVVDSLNRDVLIEVPTLAELQTLQPDQEALSRLSAEQNWRGVATFSRETILPDSLAHSRFFAPRYGIAEDPVTGSMSVPLALYLQQASLRSPADLSSNAVLPSTTADPVILEQGDCLGRAGRVWVDLSQVEPRLGGQAVTVLRGELFL